MSQSSPSSELFIEVRCTEWMFQGLFTQMDSLARMRFSRTFGLLVCFVLFLGSREALGQYSNAFDSKCYKPTIGTPGEIDSIYGSENGQYFGDNILDPGPNPSNGNNRIAFEITQADPVESIFEYSPFLDLHNLGSGRRCPVLKPPVVQAHFRSRRYTDIFYAGPNQYGGVIFWSDDNGFYDASHQTVLRSKPEWRRTTVLGEGDPFVLPLMQDTSDDVVLIYENQSSPSSLRYSYFAAFYKGSNLFGKDTVYADSIVFIDSIYPSSYELYRDTRYGDFRNSGRPDIASLDIKGSLYLLRNDRPFSLSHFVDDLRFDTVWTARENPQLRRSNQWLGSDLAMKVFPKASWDHSDDLLLLSRDYSDSAHYNPNYIYMFRGGSGFGAAHLKLDSADFILPTPDDYETRPTPLGITGMKDCGDMTGTGNRVLLVGGAEDAGFVGYYFFYVTGHALDSTVDMFFAVGQYGGGPSVRIRGDADPLSDLVFGMSEYASLDDVQIHGKERVGTIQLLHGSTKIPVKLSQRFDVAPLHVQSNQLEVYPNPANVRASIVLRGFERGAVQIVLRDVLGREVYHSSVRCTTAAETYTIQTTHLAQGSYQLELEGAGKRMVSHLTIVR